MPEGNYLDHWKWIEEKPKLANKPRAVLETRCGGTAHILYSFSADGVVAPVVAVEVCSKHGKTYPIKQSALRPGSDLGGSVVMFDTDGAELSFLLTNFVKTGGYIKVDLLSTNEPRAVVDYKAAGPGINAVNELRPMETIRVNGDQTNGDRKMLLFAANKVDAETGEVLPETSVSVGELDSGRVQAHEVRRFFITVTPSGSAEHRALFAEPAKLVWILSDKVFVDPALRPTPSLGSHPPQMTSRGPIYPESAGFGGFGMGGPGSLRTERMRNLQRQVEYIQANLHDIIAKGDYGAERGFGGSRGGEEQQSAASEGFGGSRGTRSAAAGGTFFGGSLGGASSGERGGDRVAKGGGFGGVPRGADSEGTFKSAAGMCKPCSARIGDTDSEKAMKPGTHLHAAGGASFGAKGASLGGGSSDYRGGGGFGGMGGASAFGASKGAMPTFSPQSAKYESVEKRLPRPSDSMALDSAVATIRYGEVAGTTWSITEATYAHELRTPGFDVRLSILPAFRWFEEEDQRVKISSSFGLYSAGTRAADIQAAADFLETQLVSAIHDSGRTIFASDECVVCLEGGNDALLLRCMHNCIHLKCVEAMAKDSSQRWRQVQCPLCRSTLSGWLPYEVAQSAV